MAGRRVIPDADTTALVRLDGDLTDHGPSGLAVVNNGTTVVAATGQPFAYARNFDGTSQYLTVAYNAAWATAELTISCWFRLTSITGAVQKIVSTYGASSWGSYLDVDTIGHLRAVIPDSTQWAPISDPAVLTPGQWYHAACTHSQTEMCLYKDGVLVASTAASGNVNYDASEPVTVGRRGGVLNDDYFGGQVADVRLSSSPRAPWEVAGSVLAISDPVVGFVVEADSVAVYNFNNPAEGAVVYDDAGGHNGSIVGAPTLTSGPIGDKKRAVAGTTNYISIPHHADFTNQTSKTWEFWVSNFNTPPFFDRLGGKYTTGTGFRFMYHSSGWFYISIQDGVTGLYATLTSIVGGHTPLIYLACVVDVPNTTMYGFVNGELITNDTIPSINFAAADNISPLVLGGYGTAGATFHGLRVTSRAKTPAEIYNYYHGSGIVEVG